MNKKLLSILCVCALMLAITMPSQAATGYQGYAVYRGGVAFGLEWHAGIMLQPSLTSETASGFVGQVENQTPDASEEGSWKDFLIDGNISTNEEEDFKGCYGPFYNMTGAQRNAVLATARLVAAAEIEYTVMQQIYYRHENNPTGKTKVLPSDIDRMRCDGYVEYAYEYNGIRIYGDDNYWNISKWGDEYIVEHSGISITPKKQAEDYMRFISNFE